ncbi:odorant receptor 131-2-like [Brachyhypopomus gauderio]|uniref:odorant receptor 131-2-like n=1 Tax=Brachyhypopomus gauderio TaxID=698409 RepID=UPI00404182ED
MLKKESYRAWLTCGTPDAADRYRRVKRVMASTIAEAKTRCGKSSVEPWILTFIGSEKILANQEAELGDSDRGLPITRAEVTRVVVKLLGGKAPGVDEIHPEFLTALDAMGLSWLTHDVVLLASSGRDLQLSLDQFAAKCETAGMRISTSKTETMGGTPGMSKWEETPGKTQDTLERLYLLAVWEYLVFDMRTAECNSSEEANSSSCQLQLVNSVPLRINISMAITQFFVWPFIYIDVLMLVTFSRKQAFRTETRYILFAQTLLVDLIFLLLIDFVFLISYGNVLMPVVFCIPICILMEMVTICTPTIITAMCVERYVAVCMPLRHSALSTSSRTHTAILIIWAVSTVKPLVDVIILVSTVSQDYLSQLTFCYYEIMTPQTWHREMRGLLCILHFVFIFLVELFCYVMIMLTARAASVDKKSASKGLRTVSLHMLQLTLCTMEIIYPYIETALEQLDFQVYTSVRFFNFITFSIIARAVSPLIYGIRDEKFYAAFVCYVQCWHNNIAPQQRY